MPGRQDRKWGDGTLEGDLDDATLVKNRWDQTENTAVHKFMYEEYYKSWNFELASIDVPLLSFTNSVRIPSSSL